jgi:hypothetical protein
MSKQIGLEPLDIRSSIDRTTISNLIINYLSITRELEFTRHLGEVCHIDRDVLYEFRDVIYLQRDVAVKLFERKEARNVGFIVPIIPSRSMKNRVRSLSDITVERFPPTIYVWNSDDIYNISVEEYRRRIFVKSFDDMDMFFRSWRDSDSDKGGHEFSNALYIFGPKTRRHDIGAQGPGDIA